MYRIIKFVPLKIMLFLAKINGLLPFGVNFDGDRMTACSSNPSLSLSCLVLLMFLLLIFWSNYHILLTVIAHPITGFILNFASYIFSSTVTVVECSSQIYNRHRIVDSINSTQNLNSRIDTMFVEFADPTYKPLRKTNQLLVIKSLSVLVQFVLLAVLFVGQPLSIRAKYAPPGVIAMHFYIPTISVLVSSMFCFGLLVAYQSYAKLNAMLVKAMDELRTRLETPNSTSYQMVKLSCTLSDRLDYLSMLHREIGICTKNMVDLFSYQIIGNFSYAIIDCTVEVLIVDGLSVFKY